MKHMSPEQKRAVMFWKYVRTQLTWRINTGLYAAIFEVFICGMIGNFVFNNGENYYGLKCEPYGDPVNGRFTKWEPKGLAGLLIVAHVRLTF